MNKTILHLLHKQFYSQYICGMQTELLQLFVCELYLELNPVSKIQIFCFTETFAVLIKT